MFILRFTVDSINLFIDDFKDGIEEEPNNNTLNDSLSPP